MPRKKNNKNKEEPVSVGDLKSQVEAYIFDCVCEFESISGMKIVRVDIRRYRPIGFGATETMEVNVVTE